jgi:hypothetical protein
MLGGARTGGRISIGPVLVDADERDKVRQMLFREGPVWLPAGRDLSHDRSGASDATIAPITRARKSLEYGLVTPSESISANRLTH